MKIIREFNWNRRDFSAEMECQHCGHTQINRNCYDDAYFRQIVVANINCEKCGESTKSLQQEQPVTATKYAPHQII